MKSELISGIKKGTKQAAANQASELLFEIFKSLMGDKMPDFFNTDAGKELAKGFVAFATIGVVEHLDVLEDDEDEDNEKYENMIVEYAQLQVQTATMKILEPHLDEVKKAVKILFKQYKKK